MAVDYEDFLRTRFASAGVTLNGPNDFDPQLTDPNDMALYQDIALGGSLATGEAFMDGRWTCERLDMLSDKLSRVDRSILVNVRDPKSWPVIGRAAYSWTKDRVTNLQSARRAEGNANVAYDGDPRMFEIMLGRTMAYSCGLWKEGATTLDEAQDAKLDRVGRKLMLDHIGPGADVLDIGCGWGSFLFAAAENYDARMVGISPVKPQVDYVNRKAAERGMSKQVIAVQQAYQTPLPLGLPQRFDAIATVGMIEHVGAGNYDAFFGAARDWLKDDGLMLAHMITTSKRAPKGLNQFLNKYEFTNGHVPSILELARGLEPHFVIEDMENFGADYYPTLMSWEHNLREGWDELAELNPQRYNERFLREKIFYLLTCAGTFSSRVNSLTQMVLSKNGVAGGYRAPQRGA